MVTILVIYHSQSGRTEAMARAVARGAAESGEAEVVLKKALDATAEDLISCDGLIIGSHEYFGYMAGAIKDFFDRTYEQLKEDKRVYKKPYSVLISAGNDGQGALSHIERLCGGFPLKKVQNPVISRGEITDEVLGECEELGRVMAAGCEAGIF